MYPRVNPVVFIFWQNLLKDFEWTRKLMWHPINLRWFCSIFGPGNPSDKIQLPLKSLRNFWSNELQRKRKIDGWTRAPIFHYSDWLGEPFQFLEIRIQIGILLYNL